MHGTSQILIATFVIGSMVAVAMITPAAAVPPGCSEVKIPKHACWSNHETMTSECWVVGFDTVLVCPIQGGTKGGTRKGSYPLSGNLPPHKAGFGASPHLQTRLPVNHSLPVAPHGPRLAPRVR
jgi:hypothetical protein